MSVIRQANILGQQRIDVPHLRAIESSICGDFDLLAGRALAGRAPLVIDGFKLITSGAVTADQLHIGVADGIVIHYFASESGSIFSVASDRPAERLNNTNPRVQGNFAPNQVNYIGLDFTRVVDDTTADLTMFMDATNLQEVPKTVPLGRVIDYRIVISTTDFNALPGVCPVAKVTTNSSNEVTKVEDARNLFFRLGAGGSNPNRLSTFSWPAGRKENTTTGDLFIGGDKAIGSLKGWADSIMTRLWELGGGEYWYSPTADRNVRLIHAGSPFITTGEYFEWVGNNLRWKGLRVLFDNSTASYNEIKDQTVNLTGLTDLLDGECVYVDLDRSTNRTGVTALVAQKAPLTTLGTGTPPGSRLVFAWRFGSQIFTRDQGFAAGSSFKVATIAAQGTVQLSASADPTPSTPVVAMVRGAGLYQAYAGGLTRGDSGIVSDFIGGSGDLIIGGNSRDFNVLLRTTRAQDTTKITGRGAWFTTGKPVLEIEHEGSILQPDNLFVRLRAYNDVTAQTETMYVVDLCGATGHRIVPGPPTPPTPGAGYDPHIRAKKFFQTNGEAPGQDPPVCRDQYCVMWFNGQIDILAESPAY